MSHQREYRKAALDSALHMPRRMRDQWQGSFQDGQSIRPVCDHLSMVLPNTDKTIFGDKGANLHNSRDVEDLQ